MGRELKRGSASIWKALTKIPITLCTDLKLRNVLVRFRSTRKVAAQLCWSKRQVCRMYQILVAAIHDIFAFSLKVSGEDIQLFGKFLLQFERLQSALRALPMQ